jgi:hypothetical protein
MPTAANYRDAAARLGQIAELADEHAVRLRGDRLATVFGTGQLAGAVADALTTAIEQLRQAVDGLIDLSQLCLHRAELCDSYQRQFVAWMNKPYDGTNPAEPPPKDFRWIEIDL